MLSDDLHRDPSSCVILLVSSVITGGCEKVFHLKCQHNQASVLLHILCPSRHASGLHCGICKALLHAQEPNIRPQ